MEREKRSQAAIKGWATRRAREAATEKVSAEEYSALEAAFKTLERLSKSRKRNFTEEEYALLELAAKYIPAPAKEKKPSREHLKVEAEALKGKRSLAAQKGWETRRRNERLRTPLGRAAEKLKWISRPKNYWAKRERADRRLDDIIDVAADEGVDVHELFGVLMSPEAA